MLLLIMFCAYALIHRKTFSTTYCDLSVFTHMEFSWIARLPLIADPGMLGM